VPFGGEQARHSAADVSRSTRNQNSHK
jgi:hypothetical protein